MDDAGGDRPPSSAAAPSAKGQPAAVALTAAAEQSAADWASLPPELLRLCFLKCAELVQAQAGALPLRQAAQLLDSLSPCRAWREVALAEVTFELRLAAPVELQHPLLRTLRISTLVLPSSDAQQAAAAAVAGGSAAEQAGDEAPADSPAARQQGAEQRAREVAAQLAALVAEPDVERRLSSDLDMLVGLPASAALDHPELLSGLKRLSTLVLQGDSGPAEALRSVQPCFLPTSVQYLLARRLMLLRSLRWLPARPLVCVGVEGLAVQLTDPQPQLSIELLHIVAQLQLNVSVEALSGFGCQRIQLSSEWRGEARRRTAGRLGLKPQAADGPQWSQQAQATAAAWRDAYPSPLQQKLLLWAFALQPLFESSDSLQSVCFKAAWLHIAHHTEIEDALATTVVFSDHALLRPSPDDPGSMAADVTFAGLSLSLRPGSSAGTLELTARRSSAEGSSRLLCCSA